MRISLLAALLALAPAAALATVVPGAPTTNIPGIPCSGTITQGATAQAAIPASQTIHGFTIANTDPNAGGGEVLLYSVTGTAAPGDPNSLPLGPPDSLFDNLSSYTTPPGFGLSNGVSVYAATSGHVFYCVYW